MNQIHQNKVILLIDDDSLTNMINQKLISNTFANCEISSFTSAQQALEKLRDIFVSVPEQVPDFIFLDINMPVMDGWDFLTGLEHIPETSQFKCRVYMVSSSIDQDDISKSKTFKFVCDYISKPLTKEKLTMLAE